MSSTQNPLFIAHTRKKGTLMSFLIRNVVFGAALAGAYVLLPLGASSSDNIPKTRIVGGQAKFVSSNPDAVIERGEKPVW
jgi:hypothetical protein